MSELEVNDVRLQEIQSRLQNWDESLDCDDDYRWGMFALRYFVTELLALRHGGGLIDKERFWKIKRRIGVFNPLRTWDKDYKWVMMALIDCIIEIEIGKYSQVKLDVPRNVRYMDLLPMTVKEED
jgi:hypothetical protein